MPKGYLIDLPEREREAIRRLLELPFISQGIFSSLGLVPSFSWYLLEIRKKRLVSSLDGDVDILAGRLDWDDPKAFESILLEEARRRPDVHPSWHHNFATLKLAGSGGIKWPPSTNYLIGVEAKCAYLYLPAHVNKLSEGTIKSSKSSPQKIRHVRSQVGSLLQMGFNKVALLDIIANPPAFGTDGQAWLAASNIAITSMEIMLPTLKKRLSADSLAGHWVWSIGSVIGGDETARGAGYPIQLRVAAENPLFSKNSEKRSWQEMERNLNAILTELPKPHKVPVIFIECKTCGRMHSMEDICTGT